MFVLYNFRRFFKDMPQVALDKKSNFEYLEKEIGFKRFLPKSVTDSMKVSSACWLIFIWHKMHLNMRRAYSQWSNGPKFFVVNISTYSTRILWLKNSLLYILSVMYMDLQYFTQWYIHIQLIFYSVRIPLWNISLCHYSPRICGSWSRIISSNTPS